MTKKARPPGGTHADRIRRERGADTSESPERPLITPDEMMDVLRHEIINISKGTELRLREITVLATDYAKGDTSAAEATRRYLKYQERWHDTLSSMASVEGRTDQHILREVDEVHPEFSYPPPPNLGLARRVKRVKDARANVSRCGCRAA